MRNWNIISGMVPVFEKNLPHFSLIDENKSGVYVNCRTATQLWYEPSFTWSWKRLNYSSRSDLSTRPFPTTWALSSLNLLMLSLPILAWNGCSFRFASVLVFYESSNALADPGGGAKDALASLSVQLIHFRAVFGKNSPTPSGKSWICYCNGLTVTLDCHQTTRESIGKAGWQRNVIF